MAEVQEVSRWQGMGVRAMKKSSGTTVKKAASPGPSADKQPASKGAAAASAGMFLYTDDKWSLRYYDDNDLHAKERKVFA
jgi:hypothetical protein